MKDGWWWVASEVAALVSLISEALPWEASAEALRELAPAVKRPKYCDNGGCENRGVLDLISDTCILCGLGTIGTACRPAYPFNDIVKCL